MGDPDSADNPHTTSAEGGLVLCNRTFTTEELGPIQLRMIRVKTVHAISPEVRDDFGGSSMAATATAPGIAPFQKSGRDQAEQDNRAEGIEGSRVFQIVAFYKLRSVIELSGKAFLRVWWHIVSCHYEVWKGGVRHRDISESNLMYYRNAQGVVVGVLNDFDLSSIKQGCQDNERLGTMPFMAIELLDQEALGVHITHQYRHDAESLVWVLVSVTLHYEGGTRLPRKNRPLELWQSLQAAECGGSKTTFMVRGRRTIVPPPSQQENWEVARRCLIELTAHYSAEHSAVFIMTAEEVFEKWLYNVVKDFLGQERINDK
ncbi:hypothetical protein BV22DRAFT_1074618 [Leucogyrophana mollusca]|uniref:Uncharacterized protein n=1 Tax=Leucogyrophana mollusca TaxID=85980 RepID=A0ACB8B2T2_9AGAM|nr:hypothetical protein BV22DRAFT_1074618 [Leucogyrophana mollusca]